VRRFNRFTKNESCKMGEPTDETSYYGPMARVDLRDELHEQVLKTVAQGGKLILEDIFSIKMVLIIQPLSLLIYNPEWKVLIMSYLVQASVIRAKDDNEAIALANILNLVWVLAC
jgi:succinate-semialdehyde dehydrogenase/glutarate-semialdehyde dehydrogenase